MQAPDWNDLRHVLAVAREGTLAAAARRLGVDATTVGRRLRGIESALGACLFDRRADGSLETTRAGRLAVAAAGKVEAEIGALTGVVANADGLAAGSVRVTAVPLLVSRVLVPAVPELAARHPALRLELVAEPRNLSLTRREADLALRLARPRLEAGGRTLARRVGRLTYDVYAPASCSPADEAVLPWLTYEPGMGELPQARWLAAAVRQGGTAASVAVNDAEALLHAVRAGLGRSLLPCVVADREPGLRRIMRPGGPPPPARDVWLLAHADLRPLARVAVVVDWLERTLRRGLRPSA